MIGQLLAFHIGLQRDNITTYQYIVEDHKKKRELMKRMDDLREKRILAMAEANGAGAEFVAIRLRIGGMCRDMGCAACDPMDLPERREPDPNAGFAAALGSPAGGSSLDDEKDGDGQSEMHDEQSDQAVEIAVSVAHSTEEKEIADGSALDQEDVQDSIVVASNGDVELAQAGETSAK